jgi:hypothetical protein
MSEWVKDAADRLKRRRDEEKRRLGKGPASARTLRSDAPLLWKKLAELITTAADDFNKEFADDPLCPQPLHVEALRNSLSISTVYCNSGQSTFRLKVTFLQDKASVVCSLSASDGSAPPVAGLPPEIQFRVGNDGRVELYHGNAVVGIDKAVRIILEPLLDATEMLAY